MARRGQNIFAGSSLMEQFPVYEMLLSRELLENLLPFTSDLEPGPCF